MYSGNYIKHKFTVIENNGSHLLKCVICHIILSNDTMWPRRLERHLITNHPGLKDKPIKFFYSKINLVKCIKLDSTGHFQIENEKVRSFSRDCFVDS